MEFKKIYNGTFLNKKVLVTGHTGFKGSWLCLLLNKLGADVYGYALEPPTDPSLFKEAKIDELITLHIGDIRDLGHLQKVMQQVQPEIVIHMAAQPLVRESYKIPVETYAVFLTALEKRLKSLSCRIRTMKIFLPKMNHYTS